MILSINIASEEPLYLQIRQQVVEAIAAGELAPGDRLPAVRQLAGELGVNMHTVNKAYAVLRDEGFITMRSRTGAVIAEPPATCAAAGELQLAHLESTLEKAALELKACGAQGAVFRELCERVAAKVFDACPEQGRGEC
ncbi:MAG: GntR family transcriptional regulator [Coriobacteriales bacterium]